MTTQRRDPAGRFDGGERINAETTPCLPVSCGRVVLGAPTRGPLLILWLDPADHRTVTYLAVLEVEPGLTDSVRILPLAQPVTTVRLNRLNRPQGPWSLWRCPRCGRPCADLFLFGRRAPDAAPSLGLACSRCQHLHYASRGAPVIRTKVLRALCGLGPTERIPRLPLVPDRLVHGASAIKALRLRNLQVQAVEAGTGLAVEVTL